MANQEQNPPQQEQPFVAAKQFYGGEEDEKELVETGEVGEGPFVIGEGGIVVAGVYRDGDTEKEETGRI
ncbi:hypothetical protein Tco_0964869 [Tanacetum coccineum]